MAARLADVILVAHFGIAAFIVAGFVFVPMGAARRWHWVRSRPLRLVHLCAMLFIAAESVAGIACPLTVLEDLLRGGAGGSDGFIQRWIGRLLYWDAPAAFFAALYVTAALAAVLLWRAVPPRPRRRSARSIPP